MILKSKNSHGPQNDDRKNDLDLDSNNPVGSGKTVSDVMPATATRVYNHGDRYDYAERMDRGRIPYDPTVELGDTAYILQETAAIKGE